MPFVRRNWNKPTRLLKFVRNETKLALMVEPFDFEVTRLMTIKQKSQFLDELRIYYQGQGVQLSIPEQQEAA